MASQWTLEDFEVLIAASHLARHCARSLLAEEVDWLAAPLASREAAASESSRRNNSVAPQPIRTGDLLPWTLDVLKQEKNLDHPSDCAGCVGRYLASRCLRESRELVR